MSMNELREQCKTCMYMPYTMTGCDLGHPCIDNYNYTPRISVGVDGAIHTEKKPVTRKEILEAAESIICNDRELTYGSPENNFGCIAKMWSAYKCVEFDAKDVAMMLALLKIARIGTGTHKDDNYIDLAGYAACGGEIAGK